MCGPRYAGKVITDPFDLSLREGKNMGGKLNYEIWQRIEFSRQQFMLLHGEKPGRIVIGKECYDALLKELEIDPRSSLRVIRDIPVEIDPRVLGFELRA
jgi:hypothetical protein